MLWHKSSHFSWQRGMHSLVCKNLILDFLGEFAAIFIILKYICPIRSKGVCSLLTRVTIHKRQYFSSGLGCPSRTKFWRSTLCFLPKLTLGLNSSKIFFGFFRLRDPSPPCRHRFPLYSYTPEFFFSNSNFSFGPKITLGLDNLWKKIQDFPTSGSFISASSEIPAI